MCVFQEKKIHQSRRRARKGEALTWCAEVGGWISDTRCAASSRSLLGANFKPSTKTATNKTYLGSVNRSAMQQVRLNVGLCQFGLL